MTHFDENTPRSAESGSGLIRAHFADGAKPYHCVDCIEPEQQAALEAVAELLESRGEQGDWEARAVLAEAALAQIKDMWSETRWLQFSGLALHQIQDRVLGVIESWERA